MKRRTFIKSATAAASLPALPSAAFGAAPLSAALVARAEHMAGLWVHTSAQMMKNAFRLDENTAKALFQTLRDRNIISSPNVYGVSRAILPCYDNPVFAAKVNRMLAKAASKASPAPQASHQDLKSLTQKMQQELTKKIDDFEDSLLQEDPK